MGEISQMYLGLRVMYPSFLSHFNKIYICATYFWKTLKYQISWKSVLLEPSCYMRTNTERHDEANSRFS